MGISIGIQLNFYINYFFYIINLYNFYNYIYIYIYIYILDLNLVFLFAAILFNFYIAFDGLFLPATYRP